MAETDRMPRPLEVRAARDSDREDLAAMQWQWRIDEWGGAPELERREFIDALRSWSASHDGSHRPFIARVDGRVAGMAWLVVVDRVPTPARWRRLGGHLQSVYVIPALRSTGIGSALLRAAIGAARELGLDFVLVHPSERSFAFYRRHGFLETGRFLELQLRR